MNSVAGKSKLDSYKSKNQEQFDKFKGGVEALEYDEKKFAESLYQEMSTNDQTGTAYSFMRWEMTGKLFSEPTDITQKQVEDYLKKAGGRRLFDLAKKIAIQGSGKYEHAVFADDNDYTQNAYKAVVGQALNYQESGRRAERAKYEREYTKWEDAENKRQDAEIAKQGAVIARELMGNDKELTEEGVGEMVGDLTQLSEKAIYFEYNHRSYHGALRLSQSLALAGAMNLNLTVYSIADDELFEAGYVFLPGDDRAGVLKAFYGQIKKALDTGGDAFDNSTRAGERKEVKGEGPTPTEIARDRVGALSEVKQASIALGNSYSKLAGELAGNPALKAKLEEKLFALATDVCNSTEPSCQWIKVERDGSGKVVVTFPMANSDLLVDAEVKYNDGSPFTKEFLEKGAEELREAERELSAFGKGLLEEQQAGKPLEKSEADKAIEKSLLLASLREEFAPRGYDVTDLGDGLISIFDQNNQAIGVTLSVEYENGEKRFKIQRLDGSHTDLLKEQDVPGVLLDWVEWQRYDVVVTPKLYPLEGQYNLDISLWNDQISKGEYDFGKVDLAITRLSAALNDVGPELRGLLGNGGLAIHIDPSPLDGGAEFIYTKGGLHVLNLGIDLSAPQMQAAIEEHREDFIRVTKEEKEREKGLDEVKLLIDKELDSSQKSSLLNQMKAVVGDNDLIVNQAELKGAHMIGSVRLQLKENPFVVLLSSNPLVPGEIHYVVKVGGEVASVPDKAQVLARFKDYVKNPNGAQLPE